MMYPTRKNKLITICLCVLTGAFTLAGCSGSQQQAEQRTFPAATVPAIYNDPRVRAEYLAMHYWERFDFGDTVNIGSATIVTEQALADYLSVLPYTAYNVAYEGIQHTLSMAERHPATYAFFTSMLERYLFDLNSQLRNDEYFIPVLEHMLTSTVLDDYHKMRPNAILVELQKNRPGTPAANIRYLTPSGAKDSLSRIATEFTLVMFHNLDCGNCRELAAAIDASAVIKDLLGRKLLTVLAIYHGDDLEGWKKHVPQMPRTWIHGYEYGKDIAQNATYALRIIPTLYLLRNDRTVIMRDAAFDYVEYYFNSILNPPTNADPQTQTP